MLKKLLFQLDTDLIPSAFDTVVGYDGGADHVMAYGGLTPQNVGAMVDGAIFTRAPKEKKYTPVRKPSSVALSPNSRARVGPSRAFTTRNTYER